MNRQWLTPGNDEEWLEYRKPDITSTDTAALFGLSPYKTKFELYHKHVNGIEVPFDVNERMKKGNALEFAVAKLAAEQEGWTELKPLKDYCRIPSERIGSSFDCEAIDSDGKPLLVEIKLVDFFRYKDTWIDDQAPEHIEVQVQHELELADRFERAAIVAWTGAYDCNVLYRDRDRDMGKAIRSAVGKFWKLCASGKDPQPDYTRDEKVIAMMYRGEGEVLDATDDSEIESLLVRYDVANSQKKEFTKQVDAIKAEIHHKLGDHSSAYTQRYKVTAGRTKDGKDRVAEPGEVIKGRKGYRQCLVKQISGS